jgi:hypothetical protein
MLCAEEEQIKQEVTALVEAWGMKYRPLPPPTTKPHFSIKHDVAGTAGTGFARIWVG